jgi:hypothetical protein
MEKHRTLPESAHKILDWVNNRGGIAIWNCLDLSNPGMTWTTPVKKESGEQVEKPHWSAGQITRIITDPQEIEVLVPQVVKRFHVATRMGSQGFSVKVTDGGSRRIRAAVAKAAEKFGEAWHEFDYGSYENCVILAPGKVVGLLEYSSQT